MQQLNRNYFKKSYHQFFNNQSIESSSSSEIDNSQEGEVIFRKNSTVGLPEVSRLINSAISNRQGYQRRYSFLEKKNTPQKVKWIPYEHPKISYYHLMDRAMKQSTRQFHNFFFISQCLACNAEKKLQLKITKTGINIANFINIYTKIYTYIICDENDSK